MKRNSNIQRQKPKIPITFEPPISKEQIAEIREHLDAIKFHTDAIEAILPALKSRKAAVTGVDLKQRWS